MALSAAEMIVLVLLLGSNETATQNQQEDFMTNDFVSKCVCLKKTLEGSLIGSKSLAISRISIIQRKAKWSVHSVCKFILINLYHADFTGPIIFIVLQKLVIFLSVGSGRFISNGLEVILHNSFTAVFKKEGFC